MKKKCSTVEYEYRCIDGNWTIKPVAWCRAKKGYLTRRIMKTHRCKERECMHLDETVRDVRIQGVQG